MAPKRGSTIYIPIIVPENWQLAASLVCGFAGLICLLYALFTSNWNVTTITVPDSDSSYPLTTTLKWGLRSIHIKWCVTRPRPGSLPSAGAPSSTTAPLVPLMTCSSEDIAYGQCSQGDGYWCSSAADPYISYWMIILSCVGLVLSTFFALSRRMFQPVGYSACVIACSVAIIIFRACQVLFEPSGQLLEWINKGESDTVQGVSYFVMTAGTFILLAGMLLASWGTYRVMKRGHETAPNTVDQPNGSTSGGAPPSYSTRVEMGDVGGPSSAAAAVVAVNPTSQQFQHSERVMSVIAAAPNRVGGIVGGAGGVGGIANNSSTTTAGQPYIVGGGVEGSPVRVNPNNAESGGAAGGVRRLGIDNVGMDFEALNEPSAVVMDDTAMGTATATTAGVGSRSVSVPRAPSESSPPIVPPEASPSPPRSAAEA